MNKKQFLPHDQGAKVASKLRLKSRAEYIQLGKSGNLPEGMPISPDRTYKNSGWISWGHFLGTGNISKREIPFTYLSPAKARTFVRKLKIKTYSEWREYCRSGQKPSNIPSNPNLVYRGRGWKSLGDWLGNGKALSYEDAKKLAKRLKYKNGQICQQKEIGYHLKKLEGMFTH